MRARQEALSTAWEIHGQLQQTRAAHLCQLSKFDHDHEQEKAIRVLTVATMIIIVLNTYGIHYLPRNAFLFILIDNYY